MSYLQHSGWWSYNVPVSSSCFSDPFVYVNVLIGFFFDWQRSFEEILNSAHPPSCHPLPPPFPPPSFPPLPSDTFLYHDHVSITVICKAGFLQIWQKFVEYCFMGNNFLMKFQLFHPCMWLIRKYFPSQNGKLHFVSQLIHVFFQTLPHSYSALSRFLQMSTMNQPGQPPAGNVVRINPGSPLMRDFRPPFNHQPTNYSSMHQLIQNALLNNPGNIRNTVVHPLRATQPNSMGLKEQPATSQPSASNVSKPP